MVHRHPVDIRARLILFVVVGVIVLSGCRHQVHDHRLERIAAIVSENPHVAMDSLASIDRETLSGTDRHYYDFLTVKSRDKAYVRHTSDSLYLSVLDYYTKHRDDPLYPEVLYYGGRVYSDLGDYPTALSYFQRTLDELPDKTRERDILDFKANVLSQTGRLLTCLGLYQEAVPYVESSIEIDKELKDTISLAYDLQLLGSIYKSCEDYSNSKQFYLEALKLSEAIPGISAISRHNIADIERKTGNIDSALIYFHNTKEEIDNRSRNNMLVTGARIYKEKGDLDSAYYYGLELINSIEPPNKLIGYEIILSPELRKYVPKDSIDSYFSHYRTMLVSYYNDSQHRSVINQQNMYNYLRHVREKEKIKKEKDKVWLWLLGSIASLLLISLVFFYHIGRSRKRLLDLQIALDNIETLQASGENIAKKLESKQEEVISNEKELREVLKQKLSALYEQHKVKVIRKELVCSEAYKKLLDHIRNRESIGSGDYLWQEIEDAVEEAYPDFKRNLLLLTKNNLKRTDLQIALLIKCEIAPKEIASLLNITKGGVVSRREALSVRIYGEKMGSHYIDGILRLL